MADHEVPLSALPAPTARVAAFVAILLGGLAGGLIGYTLVKLQCHGTCAAQRGIGALVGAVVAAVCGALVAVVIGVVVRPAVAVGVDDEPPVPAPARRAI